MEVALMKAERRSALGRNQTQKLRNEGWMPAVIYGDGQESLSIQISEWELEQHIKSHHRVFNLDVDGTSVPAFLQEVAIKAVSDRPLHADFLRIDFKKPLHTVLEILLIGHPAGLSKGGILVKDNLEIKITALPTKLPEALEVNISSLNTGDAVYAKDLSLSEGVTLDVDPEMIICHVIAPSAAMLAAEAAAEAAEEAGDAAPDGAGDGEGEGGS